MKKIFSIIAAVLVSSALFATTYTVAGVPKALFGTEWDAANASNDLIDNQTTGHNFIFNFADVKLAKGTKIKFKIVQDHDFNIASWPANDYEYTIEEDGIYLGAITFDSESHDVGIRVAKTGEAEFLADGYYLIGSMLDWKLENLTAELKFAENADKAGEWVLAKAALAEGDSIKVIKVESEDIKAWFGMDEDKNYVVDAKHAGEEKDIYFNPTRQEDWKGHIWIDANKEPEPEYRLENGFYLMGSMLDWKLENVNEAHKFVANEAKDGEWVLKQIELAEKDSFKVIEVAADTIKTWFGTDEDNYIVDAKHAGVKDIYFNATRQEDWKGHIWIDANKEPEPLADGYYLVGTFNDWTASAEVKLALNEAVAAQGVEEYAINIELAEGDSLKVVKIAGEERTWFPKDKNVGIDANHAGKKDVYFRPAGKDEWKEFDESGFFWIDANEPSAVENTEATVKAVKTLRNGMLIIEKNGVRYNVLGTVIR